MPLTEAEKVELALRRAWSSNTKLEEFVKNLINELRLVNNYPFTHEDLLEERAKDHG